jgi:hypothetical protein
VGSAAQTLINGQLTNWPAANGQRVEPRHRRLWVGAIALLIALAAATEARAERCVARTESGEPFPVCFDVGNQLFVSGGTSGFGGGIRLRHAMTFDDEPDLTWKLEHRLLEGSALGLDHEIDGAVYRGRYLRHARDGHLVLPLGLPKKIFLPFDIGAETAVGTVRRGHADDAALEIGAVRVAGLIDWSRTSSFRKRLAIGVLGHWDMSVDSAEPEILEHRVMPLTGLAASAGFESASGLTLGSAAIEAGRAWSTSEGWEWSARASVNAERTLIAINDRPLSIQLEAAARLPERELTFGVNARFALLARTAR